MPDPEGVTPCTGTVNEALQAVRELLAAERDRADHAFPASDPDWRLLLALYEAELEGRTPMIEEACEAAGVRLGRAAVADRLEPEGLLMRGGEGSLRLTARACEHLALWVYAYRPVPGFNPYRAAAGAPPPEPPPGPPG
jgi:hypothetical protein